MNKNLYQKWMQEVYLKLFEQNKLSYNEDLGQCEYRNSDGSKCAFGHLLRDDEYKPSMEGYAVNLFGLPKRFEDHVEFLLSMQKTMHDDITCAIDGQPNSFRSALRDGADLLASSYGLYPVSDPMEVFE